MVSDNFKLLRIIGNQTPQIHWMIAFIHVHCIITYLNVRVTLWVNKHTQCTDQCLLPEKQKFEITYLKNNTILMLYQ